jgi:hypothetical protein
MIFAKYLPHLYQGADHTGRRVLNSGGGGGGPSTSTTYTSNIPDWLRPQTEALLGAATQEYFQTEFDPTTGGYNITGTKPYTPYSADPRDYVASFSPQQQAVFREGAGMQTPGGFAQGAGMTGIAGQGGLETVGSSYGYGGQGAMYGGQGSMFGQQAAGMGGLYEQMATDPMSMQAYMSPYMQQVVERQKSAAIEDAQRANLGANLGAARQGTYGGARQALAQGMRESALEKQLGDIQAQGLQTAFDQAQRAQQFGVTTGLQGLQTGISGAQTGIQGAGMGLQGVQGALAGYGLTGQMGRQAADIGTQQQAADLARLGFQQELGAMQQQQQQAIINQAIQDYALAQEMPMQRLAGYSGLLRGYATPTTTVSQYQAAPSAASQVAGLGTALYGATQLGKKAGGVIKYAEGGITDVNALEGMAEDLSIPQLQQSMQSGSLPKYIGMPILENEVAKAERMKMAQMAMAQGQQQGIPSIADEIEAKADQLQGITDIAQPVMAAGGGMVAFEQGGPIRFQNQGYVDPMFAGDYGAPSMPRKELVELMSLQELQEYNRSGLIPSRLKDAVGDRQVESGSFMFGIPAMRSPAEFAEPAPPAQPQAAPAPAAPIQPPAPAQKPAGTAAAAGTSSVSGAAQKMSSMGDLSPEEFKRRQTAFGISGDPDAELKKQIEDMAKGTKEEREQAKYRALIAAGLGAAAGTSQNFLQNIAGGAQAGFSAYGKDIKDIKAEERDIMKMRGELARAEDARKRGDFKAFMDAEDKARKYDLDLAAQKTRDRMADIQAQYSAGRLSAEEARNQTAQARLGILQKQLYGKARKQFIDEGGEAKIRDEFEKRFGKNWIKDPKLAQSFNQQMEAQIRQIAMMDTGLPSAEDLLGD